MHFRLWKTTGRDALQLPEQWGPFAAGSQAAVKERLAGRSFWMGVAAVSSTLLAGSIVWMLWQRRQHWLQLERYQDHLLDAAPEEQARFAVWKEQKPERPVRARTDSRVKSKSGGKMREAAKTTAAKMPADRSTGKEAAGAQADDLERIEGIGPKTAAILRKAGIATFRRLAETPVDRLNEILLEQGLQINPPDTWPEQARLAAEGQWDELEALQSRLHAGRLTE